MIIIEGVYMVNDFMTSHFDEDWFAPKNNYPQNSSKTIEDYLAMDYEDLKNDICRRKDITLLRDFSIKKKLIDSPRRYDFIWFVQDATSDILATLLDEEGIEILKNTPELDSKLNAIITGEISCPYLFQSNVFCGLILSYWEALKHLFYNLDEQEAIPFFHYLEKYGKDKVEELFLRLNGYTQVAVLKEIDFSQDMLKHFLVKGTKEAIEYILSHDFRISSLNEFSIFDLFSLATKQVKIPSFFLNKRSFIEKISTIGSVKNYRYLVNALLVENDVSAIEEARKKYYEKEFSSYNQEEKMLGYHVSWYRELCQGMDSNDEQIIFLLDDLLVPYYGMSSEEYDIRRRIIQFYQNKDKEGLKRFLQQESRLQLSNMIIDYHFEEFPYNFFLDLKQLVHFQEGEGRTLSKEEIEMYSRLLVLDDLSYEEVLKLHHDLQGHSMMEEYYDHFRSAKDKQAALINQKMLTEESVQKYKDENLSNLAGVPIYVLDGDEFYAFVKSTHHYKDSVLEANFHTYRGDGGSFSLDGSNKLKTFKDPSEMYTFIYKNLPKQQIIHTYPVDSYTMYEREHGAPTRRINELLTPQELVGKSKTYNEILLALPNAGKPEDELQSSLEAPELLGIYCYDTITMNDVLSAKNMGIGIVLVKTKSYHIDNRNRMSLMDTQLSGGSQSEYDYLHDISVNDMAKRRK